jgi:hypothetical protein
MFTLTDVLIDTLWILGLAGVFATFSYMDYLRSQQQPKIGWRQMWQRPVMLTPLSVSLTLFSTGLALNGATAFQPDPLWQTAIWAVMALLFAAQSVLYWRAGQARGWHIPVDADQSDPRPEADGEPAQPRRGKKGKAAAPQGGTNGQ